MWTGFCIAWFCVGSFFDLVSGPSTLCLLYVMQQKRASHMRSIPILFLYSWGGSVHEVFLPETRSRTSASVVEMGRCRVRYLCPAPYMGCWIT